MAAHTDIMNRMLYCGALTLSPTEPSKKIQKRAAIISHIGKFKFVSFSWTQSLTTWLSRCRNKVLSRLLANVVKARTTMYYYDNSR